MDAFMIFFSFAQWALLEGSGFMSNSIKCIILSLTDAWTQWDETFLKWKHHVLLSYM